MTTHLLFTVAALCANVSPYHIERKSCQDKIINCLNERPYVTTKTNSDGTPPTAQRDSRALERCWVSKTSTPRRRNVPGLYGDQKKLGVTIN